MLTGNKTLYNALSKEKVFIILGQEQIYTPRSNRGIQNASDNRSEISGKIILIRFTIV